MATSLKFKYGSFAKLGWQPSGAIKSGGLAYDDGTVYVTKDERAMFVDLDNKRIRLEGSVQYYDSVEEFSKTTNPPYSTDTLYFFRSIGGTVVNALMAYNGSEWVQINVTLDAFTNLSTNLAKIESNVTALSTSLTNLTKRVAANETTLETHTTQISGLDTRLTTAESDIDSLEGRMTEAEKDIDTNASNITKNTASITGLGNRMTTAETNIGNLQTGLEQANTNHETLAGRVSQNETDIDDLQGRMTSAESNISKNAGDISTNAGNILTLNGKVATNTANIGTLQTDLDTAEQTIIDHKVIIDSNTDRIAAVESTTKTHTSDISKLQTATTTNASNITQLSNRMGTAEGEIDVLQEGLVSANGKINANTEAIEGLDSDLDALTDRVSTNESDIEGLKGRMTSAEGNITNLSNNKADKTTVEAIQKDLTAAIGANASDIADNAEAIADLQAQVGGSSGTSLASRMDTAEQNIGTLQGNVATINQKNESQDGEISGLKTRMTTAEGDIDSLEGRTDSLEGRMDTAESDIDAVEGRATSLEGRMTTAEGNITNLSNNKADKTYVDKEISDLKDELSADLAEEINAANAMTYMGTINDESDLASKTNVRVGDTWVLAEGKTDISGTTATASAGDFFIASGTEGSDGYIAGTVTWNHVKSGYDSAFDPTQTSAITESDNSATTPVYGKLETTLKNFSGAALSKVTIASASENIAIAAGDGHTATNAVMNVSLVWDTF